MCSPGTLACNFLFFVVFLSDFSIKVTLASEKEAESVSSSSIFGRLWERLVLIFLWMFDRIY